MLEQCLPIAICQLYYYIILAAMECLEQVHVRVSSSVAAARVLYCTCRTPGRILSLKWLTANY